MKGLSGRQLEAFQMVMSRMERLERENQELMQLLIQMQGLLQQTQQRNAQLVGQARAEAVNSVTGNAAGVALEAQRQMAQARISSLPVSLPRLGSSRPPPGRRHPLHCRRLHSSDSGVLLRDYLVKVYHLWSLRPFLETGKKQTAQLRRRSRHLLRLRQRKLCLT
ncbi:unnamed protein product [Symbiodinium necroappetens]|uniref:Uncharacterized protein n=1 Tax=Symbiodinium necroappetens TaxID=1628268 RepID=A0A812VLC0_9DINO|nr:unnamed protein product [Symbiodinium necroappetens]